MKRIAPLPPIASGLYEPNSFDYSSDFFEEVNRFQETVIHPYKELLNAVLTAIEDAGLSCNVVRYSQLYRSRVHQVPLYARTSSSFDTSHKLIPEN